MQREVEVDRLSEGVFIFSFAVNLSGFVLIFVSIICLATIKNLIETLRGTLFSLSVGNLLGCSFLLYYSIVRKYDIGIGIMEHKIHFLMTSGVNFTVMLAVCHMFCLTLAEYGIVRCKHSMENFTGLLIISWILSGTSCSLLIFGDFGNIKNITAGIVFISFLCFLIIYICSIEKHRNRKRRVERFKKLAMHGAVRNSRRNIIFPRLMLVSYFLSVLPWATQQVHYSIKNMKIEHFTEFILLVIYSLNFHVIAILCIFMRTRKPWENIFR